MIAFWLVILAGSAYLTDRWLRRHTLTGYDWSGNWDLVLGYPIVAELWPVLALITAIGALITIVWGRRCAAHSRARAITELSEMHEHELAGVRLDLDRQRVHTARALAEIEAERATAVRIEAAALQERHQYNRARERLEAEITTVRQRAASEVEAANAARAAAAGFAERHRRRAQSLRSRLEAGDEVTVLRALPTPPQ